MKKLKNIKWASYVPYVLILGVCIFFGRLSLQGNLNRTFTILLSKTAIAMVLAISLNLVVGFLGELSLGHAGFMCVGAYIGAKLSTVLTAAMAPGNEFLILVICLLCGGICAAVCGVIIGLPALRLRGDYLAIVTLAFGEIVRTVFSCLPDEWFGGDKGMSCIAYDRYFLYLYAFGIVLITLTLLQNLIRSKHGRAITAIRDSEIAARATGINVTKYKLMVFTISAFFAGIAGVLFAYSQGQFVPSTFDYNYSIEILVMVVLGGMGSMGGSLLSATVIVFANEFLQFLPGDVVKYRGLIYALFMILLVVYRNAPALKVFREKWSLRNLMSKWRKSNPAKIADDEAKWDRVPTKIMVDEVLSVDVQVNSPYTPDKAKKED